MTESIPRKTLHELSDEELAEICEYCESYDCPECPIHKMRSSARSRAHASEKEGLAMKLIGTCKECKWWNGYRCESDNLSLEISDYHHDIDITYYGFNFEERSIDFMPSDDFGCIHWEKKEG